MLPLSLPEAPAVCARRVGLHRAVLFQSGLTAPNPVVAVAWGPRARRLQPAVCRARPWLTLMHTVPAVLCAVLGPLRFMSPIRRRWTASHRASGRVFLVIAMFSGLGAILMGFMFPVWGLTLNQGITLAAGVFMLFAFVKAFTHIRARQVARHREWMVRWVCGRSRRRPVSSPAERSPGPLGRRFHHLVEHRRGDLVSDHRGGGRALDQGHPAEGESNGAGRGRDLPCRRLVSVPPRQSALSEINLSTP